MHQLHNPLFPHISPDFNYNIKRINFLSRSFTFNQHEFSFEILGFKKCGNKSHYNIIWKLLYIKIGTDAFIELIPIILTDRDTNFTI